MTDVKTLPEDPDEEFSEGGFLPKITLKHLAYFVAAADHESVTRAAESLNVSAPSISLAVSNMEVVIGGQLFVRRHARGLVLTRFGREIALDARNALRRVQDIETRRFQNTSGLEGRIDVGCLVSFAPYLMPALMRGFLHKHTKVRVHCHEGDHAFLTDGLENGLFDVALLYDFDIPSTIISTRLQRMPVKVVLSHTHRLAGQKSISLRDVIEEPYILLDLPNTSDYFLSIFSEFGLTPNVQFRPRSYEMARGLVAHQFGYSLLHFFPPYQANGQILTASPSLAGKIRAPFLVVSRLSRLHLSRPAKEFTTYAEEVISGADLDHMDEHAFLLNGETGE